MNLRHTKNDAIFWATLYTILNVASVLYLSQRETLLVIHRPSIFALLPYNCEQTVIYGM